MNGFKVTYPSGVVEVCMHGDDIESIEQFVNTKFGSIDPEENGVKIAKLSKKACEDHINGRKEESEVAAENTDTAGTLTQMQHEFEDEAKTPEEKNTAREVAELAATAEATPPAPVTEHPESGDAG